MSCDSQATHTTDDRKLCKEHASAAKRIGSMVRLIVDGTKGTCQWSDTAFTTAEGSPTEDET